MHSKKVSRWLQSSCYHVVEPYESHVVQRGVGVLKRFPWSSPAQAVGTTGAFDPFPKPTRGRQKQLVGS